MKGYISALLVALLCCGETGAQELPARIIAKVGGETIDRHEFLMRYESAVWIGENRRAQVGPAKHAFLLSLIAEKLLANEAVELGVDRDPQIVSILDEIERMLLMDALYRQEMKAGLTFSDEEIDRAARLIQQEVIFEFAVLPDERTAGDVAAMLSTGVAAEAVQDSFRVALEAATMPWGELYPPLEHVLFEQLSVGSTSEPMEIDGSWYVVRLINRRFPVAQSPGAFEEARRRAGDVLRHREERARFEAFMRDFGRGKQADVHPELFGELARHIRNYLAERAERRPEEEERYPLRLPVSEMQAIRHLMAAASEEPFIESPEMTRSLGHVMDRLSHKGFGLARPGQSVEAALRAAVWEIIAEEFLIEEARRRALDQGPGFWRDMEMWRAAYLSKGVRKVIADSVRRAVDADLWEVNVRMLEAATFEEAETARQRIGEGESMAELARSYSLDEETARNGGETGYRALASFGSVAELIRTMEIGEVAGPVYAPPRFAVVELLDRRRPEALESQLEALTDRAVNDLVARLAQEQGVHIDLDALEALQVSQLNALLVRFLGFGNRLLAVPTLPRALDWIDALQRDEVYIAL